MEEYQDSGLADEVLAHLEALVLAEQREHEKQSGRRQSQARKRPSFKKRDSSGS